MANFKRKYQKHLCQLGSSEKCFICFISDCPHYIWWNFIIIPKYEHIIAPHDFKISTTICTILVRINVLNKCRAMICLCFGIVFLLRFKQIENAVYTSFQNSMHLFINGLIFDIMNIQNNQSLEFEWVSMLAPCIRSVNDWSFPWLCNVFVKSFQDRLNSLQ